VGDLESYLIDTDIISETAKPRPNEAVSAWLADQQNILLSSVTVFELASGIQRLQGGRRRNFLEAWMARILDGPVDVLSFDRASALAAARLESEARRRGHTIDTRDLFILSIAQAHGLKIATRNLSHFKGFGVVIYNPFADAFGY